MKIYGCPEAVPAPTFNDYDYSAKPGDPRHWQTLEENHRKALKKHLLEMGHTGKYTGEIAMFGVADGYAQYMMVDGSGGYGKSSFLIHLPYGDAYQYHGIEYMPKKAIVAEIERHKAVAKLFSKQKEDA